MTRVLCFADAHLGAGAGLRSDHLGDQEAVLNQIVDVACEQKVELIIAAGDLFHRPQPAPPVLHLFKNFTRRVAEAGIPMIACVGNCGHDLVNGDVVSALELFESEWFRVSRVPELIRAAGDIAVCTLPSTPVSRLVAAADGGDRAEICVQAAELLVQTARDLHAEVPEGWPALLVGHWSVSGASLPNGLPVAALHEPVLDLAALEELGFDAMCFGHIHKGQVFESAPFVSETPTFYCGSPMVIDFGEEKVEHGCWILDFGDEHAAPEFVPLDDRRFVTVDADLTQQFAEQPAGIDETDMIAGRVMDAEPQPGDVFRIRYRATEEQHRRVDRQALLGFLGEAGVDRVHGLTWEPVRATRARVEVDGDGMSDGDALAMWCEAAGRTDEEHAALAELLGEEAAA